jgi:hypothetical protein
MAIVTLTPTGAPRRADEPKQPAARRPLRGARLGLVCNGLGEAAALLEAVHRQLIQSAGVGDALMIHKPHHSVPPSAEDWQRLVTEADVVVVGFGGCGSCSTRAVRDAMELEWEGVPAVAIVHEDMLPGVNAMTRMSGMADFPSAVVGAPASSLCDWDQPLVEIVAKEVAPTVQSVLNGE